jgi:hypothetical protein
MFGWLPSAVLEKRIVGGAGGPLTLPRLPEVSPSFIWLTRKVGGLVFYCGLFIAEYSCSVWFFYTSCDIWTRFGVCGADECEIGYRSSFVGRVATFYLLKGRSRYRILRERKTI